VSVAARRTTTELVRYCAVACVAQGTSLGLFALLDALGVEYHVAGLAGFLAAFTLNFLLNRRWTFEASGGHAGHQLARFTVINAVAIGVSLVVLHVLVEGFGVPKILAQAGAIAAGMPPNFVGQKLWGFRT
jgi:putative flippase GtrA